MGLRVEPVARDRRGRVRFFKAGLAPYRGDPHFVTPLLADCHDRWRPQHPFFSHAEAQHFVATRDGEDVGRIAACVDRIHDEVHGPGTGFFGWLECDGEATAHALLDEAAQWLQTRGVTRVRGPLSYTTNGISGLLVEDRRPGPPVFDMAYNPARYVAHLEAWGLEPARDLLAFWVATDAPTPRIRRIVERATERGGFTLRPIRTDDEGFAADIEILLRIYNGAWAANWGFVPMTEDEIRHQAKEMRPILVPELVQFAERGGEPIAFSLSLPDVNQAIGRIRGRLWPWSLARLLLGMRKIDQGRVLTLGVLPEARRSGVEMALVVATGHASERLGYRGAECSWVLEDNDLMISAIERLGGERYRTYRVYERDL